MGSKFSKLESLMAKLSPSQQQSVLDFARFLSTQSPAVPVQQALLDPAIIERPAQESVVAAIKRLKKTYYMLDTDSLLNQASSLMGQHLLHGREADSIIDELESLFRNSYQEYRQQ